MSLRDKTISGVIWSGLGTLGSSAVGFIIMMILARYLTPEDFGVIEIIISIVAISEVLVDCGFSQAIIREKSLSDKELSTVFHLNVLIAAILYSIFFFVAPILTSFYEAKSDFTIIFRVLSLKMILDSLSVTQIANCTRKMEFKTISIATFVSIVLASVLSVVGVKMELGIWAIVIYYLSLSFFKAVLIYAKTRWAPSLCFEWGVIKKYFGFGGTIMSIQIIDKAITSIESLSVGRVFSKTQLGLFSQARKFDAMVIQTMLSVVQKVCYPALAQVEGDERLKTAYKTIMQMAMWVICPIALFSLFNAETFMAVVFGEQWIDAAVYLRIFSMHSLIIPLFFICWNVFLVKGETKLLFKITVFKQSFRLIVLAITLHLGLEAVALGIVLVMIVTSLVYIFYGGKLIDYKLFDIIKDNMSTFLCSFFAVVSSSIVVRIMIGTGGTQLILFVLQASIAFCVYLLLSKTSKNYAYQQLMSIGKVYIKKILRK